ncbi:hypothetical protein [Burkholderia ubonensis]|uniref:hypothetical protein n=1 Tax=Burkholderia ubonensis TaxID=101571 RepID=UPI0007548178|nr:hypothetical protein [Burkholderia ubonensis]KVC81384.1 hypothetical protein WI75_08515 [Burkholderia ubonensis]
MINVYEIGTTLTVRDLITPQLIKLADEFRKVDAQVLQIGKRLQKMGAEVVGIRNLASASKNLAVSMKAIKDESALAEKNMFALRMALPSGGIGIEAELIAANVQARTLAATLAGIRGGRGVPPLLPPQPGPRGGGGGRHGGNIHGGNLHFGPGGVGVGGVGIGLMSDALVPLGAALVAGYVGKQFYEGAKDYQDAFMRFKSLNLGDQVNAEADKFVNATKVYGVSRTELMKALGESVGLFGNFEEARKFTPDLLTLGKANSAIFGDKNGHLDEEGLKSLLKFIDRRGGFKDEASFKRNLDLAEKLVTGSSGFLKFNDLAGFSQNAGTAFRSLSDEGLLHMEGLMIEQGGQKAGTALMSLYQNLVAGRTPKKTMGLLQDLGLATLAMQKHGAVGGKAIKSLVMTDIKGRDLLQSDPAKWMTDVLLPALKAKGITKEGDVLKAVNDVLSNRTASNQASLMTTQQLQILRDQKIASGAMGADKVTKMFNGSASGAEADFDAAWADFKKQFGTTILPQITNMLKVGADMLRSLADAANSPTFKALQSIGGGALHAFAWPYRLMFGNANAATPGNGQGSPNIQTGAQKAIQLQSTINLDGRKIGEAATDYILNGFGKAQSTSSGFDFTRSAPPIGHSFAR